MCSRARGLVAGGPGGTGGQVIRISGAFVCQPSSSPGPGVWYPAAFLIKLVVMCGDGAPVVSSDEELLGRLRAFVVLG